MSEQAEVAAKPSARQGDAELRAPDEGAATEAAEPSPASEPPLVPEGNPLRWKGLVFVIGGALPVLLLMACDVHLALSVPIGFLGCLVAAFGALELLGSFDDQGAEIGGRVSLKALLPRLLEFSAGVVALIASLKLAVLGVLPFPVLSAALLVTACSLWVVVSTFRLGQACGIWLDDETGVRRGLLARHGFWLIVTNLLVSVPMLGSFSLNDPWETHYGEVARELLVRDDWISLWWAQDGWFWSKPVLDFWLQGLSFSLLGVSFMPDQMMAGVAEGRFPQPEWAARMPILIMTLIATYVLYKAVARVFGRRAGLLGGLVLSTTPYWYFLSHQSMTDMPYVAPATAAVALIALGMNSDPEQRVRVYELALGRRTLRFSAYHLLFGVVLLTVLPQVLYLLSRNVTLQIAASPHGFRWHLDEFFAGSGGGNCGLPGNEACRWTDPFNALFQPALMGLAWGGLTWFLLWINRGERRTQRLYFLAAWYMTALAAMAKGAPGLVLPLAAGLAGLGAARRWRDFTRFELFGLVLLVACIVLPWYVQMYMRHGPQFTDRLLFHDMYKRAFVHVHDTNAGDDTSFRYYVWQLGYGLFPWTGLAAGGLLWWLKFRDETADKQSEFMSLMALWFVLAFGLFSISLTKFHHYMLPAVPPIAVLGGVLLDRVLGASSRFDSPRRFALYLAGLCAGVGISNYGWARLSDGSLSGRVLGEGKLVPASPLQAGLSLLFGLLLVVVAIEKFAPATDQDGALPAEAQGDKTYQGLMLGAIGLLAAIPTLLVGRDLVAGSGTDPGQARLLNLFSYNYKRPWPATLDFNAVLLAFSVVFALICALFVVPRLRRHAAIMACAAGVLFSAWALNVYLIKVAPHWGQRETVMAYYARRSGPDEPFVAYQMNWKGENFYTGNRMPAFVQSGAKFKNWIEEQREKGVKVVFFTTEHTRISTLKSELGSVKKFETLTDKNLNNKFFLARVEL